MFRTILLATVGLVAAAAVQPALAAITPNGLRTNAITLNGLRTNGIMLNGLRTNGLDTNTQSGAVDDVLSITLPNGETLSR